MEHIILACLWIGWCTLHSLLISETATRFLKTQFGEIFKYFRLMYNMVAIFTFFPLLAYSKDVGGVILFEYSEWFRLLQGIMIGLSLTLFYLGARKFDLMQFLGIRQIVTGDAHLSLSKNNVLNTEGILRITRHPWYLAAFFFIWSWFTTYSASLFLLCVILSVYLVIGTILEERKLVHEYGAEYTAYTTEVSMLFPFKWLKLKCISLLRK